MSNRKRKLETILRDCGCKGYCYENSVDDGPFSKRVKMDKEEEEEEERDAETFNLELEQWCRAKHDTADILMSVYKNDIGRVLSFYDVHGGTWEKSISTEIQQAMLVLACEFGHERLVWVLLNAEIHPVDLKTRYGVPLLASVCQNWNERIFDLLFRHIASIFNTTTMSHELEHALKACVDDVDDRKLLTVIQKCPGDSWMILRNMFPLLEAILCYAAARGSLTCLSVIASLTTSSMQCEGELKTNPFNAIDGTHAHHLACYKLLLRNFPWLFWNHGLFGSPSNISSHSSAGLLRILKTLGRSEFDRYMQSLSVHQFSQAPQDDKCLGFKLLRGITKTFFESDLWMDFSDAEEFDWDQLYEPLKKRDSVECARVLKARNVPEDVVIERMRHNEACAYLLQEFIRIRVVSASDEMGVDEVRDAFIYALDTHKFRLAQVLLEAKWVGGRHPLKGQYFLNHMCGTFFSDCNSVCTVSKTNPLFIRLLFDSGYDMYDDVSGESEYAFIRSQHHEHDDCWTPSTTCGICKAVMRHHFKHRLACFDAFSNLYHLPDELISIIFHYHYGDPLLTKS